MRIETAGHGRSTGEPPEDCLCEVCEAVTMLGRKWTLDLLGVLHARGTVRFNELRRELEGISPRTLSDRLKRLTEEAIVERTDHGETPPKVTYELTSAGRDLVAALEPLVAWAQQHET